MGLLNHVLNNVDKERVQLQRRLALAEERNDILTRGLVVAHHENRALGLTVRGLWGQLRARGTQEEKSKSFWEKWMPKSVWAGVAAAVVITVVEISVGLLLVHYTA